MDANDRNDVMELGEVKEETQGALVGVPDDLGQAPFDKIPR